MKHPIALSIVSVLALVQAAPSMAATNSTGLSITVDAQGRPLVGGNDVSVYLTSGQIEHGKRLIADGNGNCKGCHCQPGIASPEDAGTGAA